MKKAVAFHALVVLFAATSSLAQAKRHQNKAIPSLIERPQGYPVAPQDPSIVDDFFGTSVQDRFRPLEDGEQQGVKNWVNAQEKLSQDYLATMPDRAPLITRLREIFDYERFSAPARHGDYLYFHYNSGLEAQARLMRKPVGNSQAVATTVIDPTELSEDGTSSFTVMGFSKDNRYLAYGVSHGGSDWRTVYVKDLQNLEDLHDKVEWVKFSRATWVKDGFYYQRYPAPEEGREHTEQNINAKVYFHKIGTSQQEDQLVYFDERYPKSYYDIDKSEDERYLYLYRGESTHGYNVMILDLENKKRGPVTLVEDLDDEHSIIDFDGRFLYMMTERNAPSQRLVRIELDAQLQQLGGWKTIIAEDEKSPLEGIFRYQDRFYAQYLQDVSSVIRIYNTQGQFLKEANLPKDGSIFNFDKAADQDDLYYGFSSYLQAPTIYHYDLKNDSSKVFARSQSPIQTNKYVSRRVRYPSKDGTLVPMTILHKKGIELDGKNPALLYGYGGFSISLTPQFTSSYFAFMERGGIMAIANLRGGAEFGEAWHKAGWRLNKQNVFDDFIAAAEFLIRENYTGPNYLGINGGSNGGLLVGAVMTQRPELFQVAIPEVGVHDMLRFHKFTIGYAWAKEFGSSEESAESFQNLYGYSPLHNIQKQKRYPATLVMTAATDDRVVPAHSFKFAAELQASAYFDPKKPVILRVTQKAGHGAGSSMQQLIEKTADRYAFLLNHTRKEK